MIQQKLTKEMNQSPKGLGYCTHSEKLGRKMKGKDGNKWIIIENKNKVKRWIKLNNDSLNKSLFNKLFSKLEKKIYKWWLKLSNGYILIIYKDNYKLSKIKVNQWKEYENESNIKAILWCNMSIDSFEQFINYLKSKLNIDEINNILKEKNLNNYFTKNYKIYFKKEKL